MTTWTTQDKSGAVEVGVYWKLNPSSEDIFLLNATDKFSLNASVEQELTTTWTNQPKS